MKNLDQPSHRGLLLAYHLLVEQETSFAYGCTRQQFDSHLASITAPGPNASPQNVWVSFDDGHASQHRYAFPLLGKYGVRGVFFSIVERAEKRADYMGWEQLRELVNAGHQVGSHGMTHRFLTQCSAAELQWELEASRNELEQHLQTTIDAISIPFGRWDRRVLQACADAGYTRIYTSDPRLVWSFEARARVFGRYMVRRSTTIKQIARAVGDDRALLRRMQAEHYCKLCLRSLIGEQSYHRLWGIISSRKSLEDAGDEY